ncbi:MAG: hypothetical protein V1645_03825 [archaeon]
MSDTEMTKKDSELFRKLAEKTDRLSQIEKVAIISEVKILDRPPYHKADMNGQGIYILNGTTMFWSEYADAKIREHQRLENNKSKPLYQ